MPYTPKKVLAVFAHPDDETFGTGGTLALWAKNGVKIHLLTATRGEAGQNPWPEKNTARLRTKELKEAAKILGIQRVEFLGFKDGEIGNNDLAELESFITKKIEKFRPDTLITYNLNGLSGHLDHIAVASATTQSFKKTEPPKRLYYFTLPKIYTDQVTDFFIHFPEGKEPEEMDERIDISSVWQIKIRAMYQHKTQVADVERILNLRNKMPDRMVENFLVREKRARDVS